MSGGIILIIVVIIKFKYVKPRFSAEDYQQTNDKKSEFFKKSNSDFAEEILNKTQSAEKEELKGKFCIL
jgi:hypothetical protein